jgi:hypothetical protein
VAPLRVALVEVALVQAVLEQMAPVWGVQEQQA